MSEEQHPQRDASEADFLAFFQMGGILTLTEAKDLTHEEVAAAIAAREKYEAMRAVLYARAHDDAEAVLSVVDGGEVLRANVLSKASATLREAWTKHKRPVDWSEI